MGKKRKSVVSFNHIGKNLQSAEVDKLTRLYSYYHRLATCYKWKHTRLKRLKMILETVSIGLTVVGGIAGGVTANPLILGTIAGPGVLIQGYMSKSGMPGRLENCEFAHVSYHKVLTQIRSFLRGVSYDETVFLSDVRVLDDIVTEVCPHFDSMITRYHRTYDSAEPAGPGGRSLVCRRLGHPHEPSNHETC